MTSRSLRRAVSNAMVGLMILAVVVALLPLFFILLDLVVKGAGSLSVDFFTRMPAPAGESGGGVAHAIVEGQANTGPMTFLLLDPVTHRLHLFRLPG